MFRKDFHLTHSRGLDSLVLVLIGGLIMGWLAPQVWTFQGQLPITPQSLLVVLWGVLWGWQVGTCAVLLYLVAGGLGLPVFADGASGWTHFTGSTAGFLFAFPMAALVTGWAAEEVSRMRYGASALLLLLGHAVILGLGLLWQRSIVPVEVSLADTLVRLMPAVLVKTALGTLVVVFCGRAMTGHRQVED